MSNLKIADNEYAELSSLYKDLGTAAENELLLYLKALDELCTKAIPSGQLHENLYLFKQEAEKLKNQILDLTAALSKSCSSFIEDIDESDKYLY